MPKTNKQTVKFKREYIYIIILSILALIIFFSSFKVNSIFNLSTDETLSVNASEIETKLSNILSKVDGVGKAIVSINVDNGEEVVLKNTETITENGKTTRTESAVLINGKPYVVKENSPKILGVVVVCEGADDLKAKLVITEVITTSLGVSSDNIRIIKMK